MQPFIQNPDGSYVVAVNGCITSDCPSNGWQFFDPLVAIGYDYKLIPDGDYQQLSYGVVGIQIPTVVGSGVYDLYLCDVGAPTCDFATGQQIIANGGDITKNIFDVVAYLETLSPEQDEELGISDPTQGISEFAIRGIDPNAGVDPNNPLAFITGLLFTGVVDGNVQITPETIDPPDPVPEPGSLALFAGSLLLLARRLRRRR